MEYKYRCQTEPKAGDNGKLYPSKYTPFDFYNVCLKIAEKRAYVDGAIRATGASAVFTQDTEEDPEKFRALNGENGHARQPAPKPNINGHAAPTKPAPEPVPLKGVVSGYEAKASAGKLFHAALVGEVKVFTTEFGDTLKKLAGLEVSVLAVQKRPDLYQLQSIQAVASPNGATKRPAAKPDDEAIPAERSPWEEVQRQLVESDINEHWALKAAQRLQFIPASVQRLGDLSEKQLKVLLVRWSDLIKAAREEEQGIVEEAAA